MPGFFGTESQVRLQRRSDEAVPWSNATPGACVVGRMIGTDDPDRFGRDRILETIGRDGAIALRLIPVDLGDQLSNWLTGHGYRTDWWDVFSADQDEALAATAAILASRKRDDLRHVALPNDPEGIAIREVQALMHENGVVPFSGSMLLGALGPARTIAIADAGGRLVAAAHAYLPHNRFSRHQRVAWGGLVAVAASERGKGLGSYVNALMVQAALIELGATRIHEFATATNLPSRRMIEASGLRLDPTVRTGIASTAEERFTR